jgi:8-oxo-dGTP pyrophosphatase MutT (NUDIX family)|tara:strand:+ start:480 stop:635 length:156 start_codon:yes stop_codon:yes gene_type:complete
MINVVGAILFKDNKIILARRAKTLKNFPDLFEFPGGKVEKMKLQRKLYPAN